MEIGAWTVVRGVKSAVCCRGERREGGGGDSTAKCRGEE